MKTMHLTQAQARATDGALCWKPKHKGPLIYGSGCSLLLGHDIHDGTPHRFDLAIKADPMPRGRLLRLVALNAAVALPIGAAAELVLR